MRRYRIIMGTKINIAWVRIVFEDKMEDAQCLFENELAPSSRSAQIRNRSSAPIVCGTGGDGDMGEVWHLSAMANCGRGCCSARREVLKSATAVPPRLSAGLAASSLLETARAAPIGQLIVVMVSPCTYVEWGSAEELCGRGGARLGDDAVATATSQFKMRRARKTCASWGSVEVLDVAC